MELVALIFGIALLNENAENEKEIVNLNSEISQIQADFLTLAGSHAAVSARDKSNHESQQDQIDDLVRKVLSE